MTLHAIFALTIGIVLGGLGLGFLLLPKLARQVSGHQDSAFAPIMAGRYVGFASIAILLATTGTKTQIIYYLGLFVALAAYDTLVYMRLRGDIWPHLLAGLAASGAFIWLILS